jgi:hypothetical protein
MKLKINANYCVSACIQVSIKYTMRLIVKPLLGIAVGARGRASVRQLHHVHHFILQGHGIAKI